MFVSEHGGLETCEYVYRRAAAHLLKYPLAHWAGEAVQITTARLPVARRRELFDAAAAKWREEVSDGIARIRRELYLE
jgi:hypothetical protein